MITGVHSIVYTEQADEVRAFFRDVLERPSVDAGGGWLIFGMPPAELAVHPGDDGTHELYLMCDDIEATIKELAGKGVTCAPVTEQSWGLLSSITLGTSTTQLGLYEPRHPSPPRG